MSTSGFSSAWGSSGFKLPKLAAYTPVKAPAKAHSSFLGNLLGDAVSTAKGIPFGIVNTVEHPIRMAEQIGHQYKAEYSPLVHGQFHTFFHNVYEHPLAPIMDALTVASLGAGGVGFGLRTADTLAGSEGSVLSRAAELARPGTSATTKELYAGRGTGPVGYHHYSTNMFRRYAIQKPTEGALTLASKAPLARKIFGRKGMYDYTTAGRQLRWQLKNASQREAGARNFMGRQMVAYRKMLKDPNITPQDLMDHMGPRIEQGIVDHALSVKPARNGLPPKMPPEWQFIREPGNRTPHILKSKDPADVARWLERFGNRVTTLNRKDPATLMKDTNGHYLVVHKYVTRGATKEAENTYRALHALYHTPTRVWKWLVLASAPRYFVNNAVGNGLMLMFSHDPVSTLRGLHQAVADVHGSKVAEKSAANVADAAMAHMAGTWQHKWYLGAHTGLVHDLQHYGETGAANLAKKHLSEGLYGVTAKATHNAPRMIALNRAMAEHPIFQKLYAQYRTHPLDTQAFAKAADEASRNPAVRDFVEKRSSDVMGQYYHFNSLEKRVRMLVPFYSWDRHVMRFAKEFALDTPGRAGLTLRVGAQGNQDTHNILGKIPDWMQGAIPLRGHYGGILGALLGGDHAGRSKVLLTGGLNPLSSAADVLKAGQALTTGSPNLGEDLGGQLNPLVTGAIESLTGQSVLTGAKIKRHGGLLTSTALSAAEGNPVGQILKTTLEGRPLPKQRGSQTKPLLFRKDERQVVSSFLGLPIRDMSPQAAAAQYDQAHGIHKGHTTGPRTLPKVTFSGWPGPSTYKQRRTIRRALGTPRLPHPRRRTFHVTQPRKMLPTVHF